MAKYKMEISQNKIVKTFSFLGKEFIEVWGEIEGSWGSKTFIEQDVIDTFPFLDPDITDIIEELTSFDEDEMMDAITELTKYENDNITQIQEEGCSEITEA